MRLRAEPSPGRYAKLYPMRVCELRSKRRSLAIRATTLRWLGARLKRRASGTGLTRPYGAYSVAVFSAASRAAASWSARSNRSLPYFFSSFCLIARIAC